MQKFRPLAIAVLVSIASALPVAAEVPVASHTPVGGALAAKIIGETCPGALTSTEIGEITHYLDNIVAIEKAKSPEDKALMDRLMPELEADYRSNRTCGVGDDELAKDMLLRVRKEVETIR